MDQNNALAALPKSAKPRDVVRLLAELVEAEGLGIGDRLPPELELARRFGLSRSTLREALRQWESLGVIERNKGAGTKLLAEVSTRTLHLPLTVKIEAVSLSRMLAVRRPLEIEACRIAALNADAQAKLEISNRLEELMRIYDAGEDWRAADARFHAAIHAATGNPLFAKVIAQIHQAFHGLYEAPFDLPQLGSDTIPMHRALAAAILAGDAEASAAVMGQILADVDVAAKEIADGLNDAGPSP